MSHRIEPLEPRRLLSRAGELDLAFGNHFGIEWPAREDRVATCVGVQSDGRTVVAGHASDIDSASPVIWRFNRDGSLDRGFGDHGVVRDDLTPAHDETVDALAMDASGRIVIAGTITDSAGSHGGVFVARYLRDGTLDRSFNQTGLAVTHELSLRHDSVGKDMQLIVEPDGGLLLGGTGRYDDYDMVVARFDADGVMDATFGDHGIARVGFGDNHWDIFVGMSRAPDGSLSFVGRDIEGTPLFARLSSSGAIASPSDLMRIASPGSGTFSPVLQAVPLADGRIAMLVAQDHAWPQNEQGLAVRVLRPDGAFDPTFAGDGSFNLAPPDSLDDIHAKLLPRPDGGLLAFVGQSRSDRDVVMQAIRSDGSVDASFASASGLATPTLPASLEVSDVALAPDGRIVAIGTQGTPSDVAVVRLTPNGEPDPSFSGHGMNALLPRSISGNFTTVVPFSNGSFLAGGSSASEPRRPLLARFNADGSPDMRFGGGSGFVTLRETLGWQVNSIVVNPDSTICVATNERITRFTADGRLDRTFAAKQGFLYRGATALAGLSPGWLIGIQAQEIFTIPADGNPRKVRFVPNQELRDRLVSLHLSAIRVLDDGRVLLGGDAAFKGKRFPIVVRLRNDRQLDTSFDGDGIVVLEQSLRRGDVPGAFRSFTVRADGALLVSIAGGSRPRLVQLDAHGSTDRRFGPSHDGAIAFLDSITPDATGLHWPGDVAYQSDGRILLSGAARDLNSGKLETLTVARLGADGSYDSTFGAGGVARFSFGGVAGSGDTINALALTDGHALAVGSSYNGKPLIASLLLH